MFQSLLSHNQPGTKTFVDDAGGTLGIVGASTGGYNSQGNSDYQGELIGIYVLPTFQHRGIGCQLTRAVKTHLLQLDLHGMLVWVFAENPNLTFYTHLGGNLVEEKCTDFAEIRLKELAFGWKDIHAIKV